MAVDYWKVLMVVNPGIMTASPSTTGVLVWKRNRIEKQPLYRQVAHVFLLDAAFVSFYLCDCVYNVCGHKCLHQK